MEVKKLDATRERQVLIGMVTSDAVLGAVSAHWSKDMFRSKWANIVSNWCNTYYGKYNKAPNKDIQGIFTHWAGRTKDSTNIEVVDGFLQSLSDEYDKNGQVNTNYLIDTASVYFNEVRTAKLAEEIQYHNDAGDVKQAQDCINSYRKLEMGIGEGVNVLEDAQAIKRAMSQQHDVVIHYPGDAGKYFATALERDAFVAFMAPDKRGKSYLALDIAWHGMLERRKVAYFQIGDLSEAQVMHRFMTRAMRHPLYSCKWRYPKDMVMANDEATVTFEDREEKTPTTWQKAYRACQKIIRTKTKSKTPLLKLSVHGANSITVGGIKSVLEAWERNHNWVADVVIIDYADVIEPMSIKMDYRHQVNSIWTALSSLRQEKHYCLVTFSQSDAGAYKAKILTKSNFSDDKRKLAHVTCFGGINQTPEEQKQDIVRLNWIVARGFKFSEYKCLTVATCLDSANFIVRSHW